MRSPEVPRGLPRADGADPEGTFGHLVPTLEVMVRATSCMIVHGRGRTAERDSWPVLPCPKVHSSISREGKPVRDRRWSATV